VEVQVAGRVAPGWIPVNVPGRRAAGGEAPCTCKQTGYHPAAGAWLASPGMQLCMPSSISPHFMAMSC
jgi:hypothetical protein